MSTPTDQLQLAMAVTLSTFEELNIVVVASKGFDEEQFKSKLAENCKVKFKYQDDGDVIIYNPDVYELDD